MAELAQEIVECPWCWEPVDVVLKDGLLLEHADLVPGRSCRGGGKKMATEGAFAVAFDRMCRAMLDELGFHDWRVRWSPDSASVTHHSSKEIWQHDRRARSVWFYCKEAFLHEVAHIDGGPVGGDIGCNQEDAHGPQFFMRYGNLLVRFADWHPGMAFCDHGCVICGNHRPDMLMHVINGLHYHHDCAEDRGETDVCPDCEDADA